MSRDRLAWLAAPSLALGFLWIPVRYGITQVDSPRSALSGAPLPWRSPSIAFSMETDVFWGPLLIDAAFWLLVALGLIRLWGRYAPSNKVLNLCGGLAIAVVGMTGALFLVAVFTFGSTSDLWYGPHAMTFVSLGVD